MRRYGKVIKISLLSPAAKGKGNTPYTLCLAATRQWEGHESGLYYNDFRYYEPGARPLLSPDPLGRLAETLGSSNAYAYVNNNR